jgi:monoamine oxidase
MFPPGFAQKYEAELKKPAGNIYFASSDWADGWRGWIDGAIEQGALAAQQVAVALQNEDATAV